MAYKEMPYSIYFTATVSLYLLEILGAIFISDIGMIFGFVSAIAVSNIAFVFPGWFYIAAENKFATDFQKQMNKWVRFESYLFMVFGSFAAVIQLTTSVLGLVTGHSSH